MSYTELADRLEAFANETEGQWAWDHYMSAILFDDAYLEEVPLRMIHRSDELPALQGQGFCPTE